MKIVFILIGRRTEEAVKVQSILSEYGDIIRTRLGINRELYSQDNDASGFVFLELSGDEKRGEILCETLNEVPNVKAECISIAFP